MKSSHQMKIIQLMKHGEQYSRQDISRILGISMPTALRNIDELLEAGIITEAGSLSSTGGRRAKVFELNKNRGYTLALQVSRKHLRLAITDLSGRILHVLKTRHGYHDDLSWYMEMEKIIDEFVSDSQIDSGKIIGAGLSFPGIIDQEKNLILHSHVFDIANIELDRFYKYVPYPLYVANDANCACYAEQNQEKESYLYLSLNESVGGAIMWNRKLITGGHWRAGEAGHIIIHPKGRICYCGKEGCADAYLATSVLLTEDGELDTFFDKLGSEDPDSMAIWDCYLDDLALLVSNLNMLLDMDIVLGGDIGARMDKYIDDLCLRTKRYDRFSRDVDYIFPCCCKEHIFLTGAALGAIDRFDDRLLIP